MPPSKKSIRKRCAFGAANALIEALKQHDMHCVCVGDTAAYLNGTPDFFDRVEVVVFSTAGRPQNPVDLLVEQDPHHFERRGKRTLIWHDRSGEIPEGMKNWFEIGISAPTQPPAYYKGPQSAELQGLPTLKLIPLIHVKVRDILRVRDSSIRSKKPWPGHLDARRLNALLKSASNLSRVLPLEFSFVDDAVADFKALSALLPDYSTRLQDLIAVCEGAKRPVDLVVASQQALSPGIPSTSAASAPTIQLPTATIVQAPASRRARRPRKQTQTNQVQSLPQDNATQANPAGPTPTQILFGIAKQVIAILKQDGIDCVLFGSLGTSLYGKQRSPNDIDMLTFPTTDPDPERLKQLIANANSDRFFLRDSVNPAATYKILYYKLRNRENPNRFFRRNSCKVDILVPDIMHLPSLPSSRITWIDDLPVLPFSVLLLQKLQAWDDHRNMEDQPHKFAKRLVDKNDLERMFKMEKHVAPLRTRSPWKDRVLFSEEFEALSRSRARVFCEVFPAFKDRFKAIGLLEDDIPVAQCVTLFRVDE